MTMMFRHSPKFFPTHALSTRLLKKLLPLAIAGSLLGSHQACANESESIPAPAKRNVILIVGDGMDDHQITIARNYLQGARGKLLLDELPLRSTVQVLTVEEQPPHKPLYVADSANSASSLATGVVTSLGRISTTPGDDRDVPTIAELAKAAGYATGIVSTASVTDATPAAFMSHVASRVCEDSSLMQPADDHPIWLDASVCIQDKISAGGPGSIAQQIALSNTDIVLGGGLKHFQRLAEDSEHTILELAQQQGYQLVTRPDALDKVPAGAKVLGLFANGTLPPIWQGENGRSAEKPTRNLLNRVNSLLGSVTMPEPMRCVPNPSFVQTPTLQQMTTTALRHLAAQDSKGFFLMVESASIDKQAHRRNPCGSIGEVQQLEEAVAAALNFATQEPETLILVTADHAQAAQLIADVSLYAGGGVEVYTPGHVARILTPEDQLMAVNYATNNFFYEDHSGANVPLYSNTAGVGRVASMVTQPEIFHIMADYLQLPVALTRQPLAD